MNKSRAINKPKRLSVSDICSLMDTAGKSTTDADARSKLGLKHHEQIAIDDTGALSYKNRLILGEGPDLGDYYFLQVNGKTKLNGNLRVGGDTAFEGLLTVTSRSLFGVGLVDDGVNLIQGNGPLSLSTDNNDSNVQYLVKLRNPLGSAGLVGSGIGIKFSGWGAGDVGTLEFYRAGSDYSPAGFRLRTFAGNGTDAMNALADRIVINGYGDTTIHGNTRLGVSYTSRTYIGPGNSGFLRGDGAGYLVVSSNPRGYGDKNIYLDSAAGIDIKTVGRLFINTTDDGVTDNQFGGSARFSGDVTYSGLNNTSAKSLTIIPGGERWIYLGIVDSPSTSKFMLRLISQESEEHLTFTVIGHYFPEDSFIKSDRHSYNETDCLSEIYAGGAAHGSRIAVMVKIRAMEHEGTLTWSAVENSGTVTTINTETTAPVFDYGVSLPLTAVSGSQSNKSFSTSSDITANSFKSRGSSLKGGDTRVAKASDTIIQQVGGDAQCCFIMVDGDNGYEGFYDIVTVAYNGQPHVIFGESTYGGPLTRSYWKAGGNIWLKVEGGTAYDVNVRTTSLVRG